MAPGNGMPVTGDGHRGGDVTRQASPPLLSLLPALAVVVRERQLLWHLTIRQFRAQYKQSFLGYAWLFVNPLTYLATLAFIFSVIFKSPSQGQHFILFVAVGLFPWMFFATATSTATSSVISAANLINSVYFPRELLVIAAVLVRLIDFLASLTIVLVAFAYYGEPLYWTLLWTPLLFTLQFLFTVGLSLPLAALNLFFHDIHFLVGVVLNLWFFFTPIFYSVDIVPDRYRLIYELNPLARFVGSYREAVLQGGGPPLISVLLAVASTGLALILGHHLFCRMEPRFADRV